MSDAEIDLFTEALLSARNYLEYGAGGSTRRAARLSTLASIVRSILYRESASE
jgi:hypothetical protein